MTQDGQFEFLHLPFGLTNAPSFFQRTLNAILGNLRFTKVLIYLDDILIPGKTLKDVFDTLREVLLEILKQN